MTTASRSEIPEGRILICICTRYTIKYLPYPAFVTKISGFLIKSLPKIAENRVKMAFIVRKKAEKPLKAELKTQFGKEVKNVLELI